MQTEHPSMMWLHNDGSKWLCKKQKGDLIKRLRSRAAAARGMTSFFKLLSPPHCSENNLIERRPAGLPKRLHLLDQEGETSVISVQLLRPA